MASIATLEQLLSSTANDADTNLSSLLVQT